MNYVAQDVTSRSASNKRQIAGLDILRALAAVLVFCFHLGFWTWRGQASHPSLPRAYVPLSPLFANGWIGVEIFFVLSGFVIAYSTEGATPVRFLQHRVQRLFPAAFVCSSLTGLVLLTVSPWRQIGTEWVKSLVFFPVGPWIDGSYWTLPIEVSFYGLVLLCLVFQKARHMPLVMASLGLLSATSCVLVLKNPAWPPRWLMAALWASGFPPGACSLLIHGTFFALGVFLFLLLVHEITPFRVLSALVCVVGCLAELVWHNHAIAFATGSQPKAVIPILLWTTAVVGLIASVRWNASVSAVLGQRGARLTRRMGIATYPLYLLHATLGNLLNRGLHHRAHMGYGTALIATLIVVGALAVFVAEVLEPRIRLVLQAVWSRGDATRLRHASVLASGAGSLDK